MIASSAIMQDEVNNALTTLKTGGIILYPTDTIWGIGCDASNAAAINRVYHLKKRNQQKSMIVLLDSYETLKHYVSHIPKATYGLLQASKRPLTLVLSGAKNLPSNLIAKDGTIGIRIPKHAFCQQLIRRMKQPLVATSANISGQPFPRNFEEIQTEILQGVDYTVNLEQDTLKEQQPSQIVQLTDTGRCYWIR